MSQTEKGPLFLLLGNDWLPGEVRYIAIYLDI